MRGEKVVAVVAVMSDLHFNFNFSFKSCVEFEFKIELELGEKENNEKNVEIISVRAPDWASSSGAVAVARWRK